MGGNCTDWIKDQGIKVQAWIKTECKSIGKFKLISSGFVIMLFIFVAWHLVTYAVEDAKRKTDWLIIQNNFDYKLKESEYRYKLNAAEAAKIAMNDAADAALGKKKKK